MILRPSLTALVPPLALLTAAALPAQVGGSWETVFAGAGAGDFDHYGSSAAFLGDVDGDGASDFAIGAPNLFGYSGRMAYVDVHSGATQSLLFTLTSGELADEFGSSVAAAGDVDLDGHADLLVGAVNARPTGLTGSGSAYLYSGRTQALIRRYDFSEFGAHFGASVADAGDVDGDGVTDQIIGAPDSDAAGFFNGGNALVYSGATGAILFRLDGANTGAQFGAAVAGAGDGNGDGHADFLVGAPSSFSSTERGRVFLHSGADGAILRQFISLTTEGSLGRAVATVGDQDGDGRRDFLLGDPTEDPSGINQAGSAYLYSSATGMIIRRFDGTGAVANLGKSLADAGDVNEDGVSDIILGAPGTQFLAGAAHVFSGVDGALLRRYDGGDTGDGLGTAVAGGGALGILVGTPYVDPGGVVSVGESFLDQLDPFLRTSATEISASAGGIVAYSLDFPLGAEYDEYQMLASANGTGPTDLFGLAVPLTLDNLFLDTFFGNYPSEALLSGFTGRLDGNGVGTAYLGFYPHALDAYVGTTLHLAAVAGPPQSFADHASVAATLRIVP